MAPRTGTLLLAALLVALAGCGDDDAASDGGTTSSAVTSVDADAGDDDTDEDPPGEGTTTTTDTVPDAEAEEPPGGSGEDGEGAADDFVYVAELTGDAGSGRAELQGGGPGELCVDIEVTGLGSEATAAHVHESQDGEIVVALGEPSEADGGSATWDGVCIAVDEAVAEALAVDATGFHVDVETGEQDGAVRGQLEFATIFDLELS